ncbi:MAG: LamG-like jellyroll fold domain-containing protein [Burkholderiales bacterium]
MPIASNLTSGPYTANGVQVAFPFDFTVVSSADVQVQVNGVVQSSSLYTVALSADGTGTVTFSTPPANGASVLLVSNPDFLQETQFETEGAYSLSQVNTINRRDAVRTNWLAGLINRLMPGGWGTPANRAGRFLSWDAGGDPIYASGSGADSALRTDLAASGGSALIGFKQSGTGATSRTVQAKLRDTLNVRDFGAAGNNTVDDSAAINAARGAANARGTALDFSPGAYRIPGLTIFQTGEAWDGARSAFNYGVSTTSVAVHLDGTPVNTDNNPFVHIRNLTLHGDGETNSGFIGGFVSTLENVNITGATVAGLHIKNGPYPPQTSYYDKTAFNGNYDGVLSDSGGLIGTQFFSNCTIRQNSRYGINGQFEASNFHRVIFESNVGSGMNLTGNNDCLSLTGGTYFEQNDAALGANGYHIRMNATGKGVVSCDAVKFGSTGVTKVAKIDGGRIEFRNCAQAGDQSAYQLIVADTAEVFVVNSFYGLPLPPNVKVPARVSVSPLSAIIMGGTGDSVDISSFGPIFGSGAFTFSAVIECDTSGAAVRQICVGATNSFQLSLTGSVNATQNISWGRFGSAFVATVAGDIPVRVPVHLAYTRSAGVGQLYQNGIKIWQGVDTQNYSGALQFLGELSGLNGKLYACGWHNAALTSQQVFDVWRCGGDLNAAGINATANMLSVERAPGRVWFEGNPNDFWAGMIGGVRWGSVSGSALAPYTVATLPAGYIGATAMVIDATSTSFWTVVAGGGANTVRVTHDGTNWRVG